MNTKNTLKNTTAPVAPVEAPQGAESSIRQATGLFDLASVAVGATAQQKQAFMGDIRQKLAQVADEAKKAGDEAQSVESLADVSATRLFRARVEGMISGEELSSLLVDVFGAEPKRDGTPGKSPKGKGKTIRQRVVRAVQGHDFINGADGGRFFETLDPDTPVVVNDTELTVRSVIENIGKTETIDDGGKAVERLVEGASIWNAYKLLGDMKSVGTVRLPFAFDPKKIIGLTESLSEAGARGKLLNNPSLLKAYAGLFDQLVIINTVDEGDAEAVKAAMGVADDDDTDADEADEAMAA